MSGPHRDPREVVREEPIMRRRILDAVQDAPLSVPDIAAQIGSPTHEVMVWVMGMRRYGYLAEVKGSADDGYFLYEAAGRLAS
jgi:predicted Rossmann fold nucleotide-binding protein DprA/Smf involved in DNA uptake